MMETAHIMGISAGILFIDLQKFCDSVDLVLLIKACSVLECPRIPLLLLVQAFLGPRTLRADGHHSEQIPVSYGMVAGSSQATHLALTLLHRVLHDHHQRCPKLAVSQFVDDLKMHTEGTRAFPFSWQAQSRSVALNMWIRGHHTRHSPYCLLRLTGKRFRHLLNQACKRFGC